MTEHNREEEREKREREKGRDVDREIEETEGGEIRAELGLLGMDKHWKKERKCREMINVIHWLR